MTLTLMSQHQPLIPQIILCAGLFSLFGFHDARVEVPDTGSQKKEIMT